MRGTKQSKSRRFIQRCYEIFPNLVRGEPLHQDVTEADLLADWPGEALTADMDEEGGVHSVDFDLRRGLVWARSARQKMDFRTQDVATFRHFGHVHAPLFSLGRTKNI